MKDFILAPYYWIRGWFIYTICVEGTPLFNSNNGKYYRIVERNIIVRQGSTVLTNASNITIGKYYHPLGICF